MATRRNPPGPSPLGDVLEGTRRVTLERTRAAIDRDTWRRALGRRIAERTEVGQLRGGELLVYVASAAWAQELSLLTREILERLAAHGVRAERIRFRVRPELGASKAASAKPESAQPPAAELPAELDARLKHVADDELRGAIAGAATLAMARIDRAATRRPLRTTSVRPDARTPRAAATRSAPSDQSSAASSANPRRKRGGPAG